MSHEQLNDFDALRDTYADIIARVSELTGWNACHISGPIDYPEAMEFGVDLDDDITSAYNVEPYDGWLSVTLEADGWHAVRTDASDAVACPAGAHQPFAAADATLDDVAQQIARLWCAEHTRDGCLVPETFRPITARDTMLILLREYDPNGAWSVDERDEIADITDEQLRERLADVATNTL
jgi:hypothetical protein